MQLLTGTLDSKPSGSQRRPGVENRPLLTLLLLASVLFPPPLTDDAGDGVERLKADVNSCKTEGRLDLAVGVTWTTGVGAGAGVTGAGAGVLLIMERDVDLGAGFGDFGT